MERYYPVLRFNRSISYIIGDVAIVAASILALRTLRHSGEVPTFWLIIALVVPFVAVIGIKGTGDLFGMWLDKEEQPKDQVQHYFASQDMN